jgi:UrcA family protein
VLALGWLRLGHRLAAPRKLIMSNRLIPVLAAAIGLAGAGASLAQPGPYGSAYGPSPADEVVVAPPYLPPGAELRREAVSFADLDLGTRAGAYTLLMRIRGAARRVCSPEPSTPADLRDSADYHGCFDEAMGRAVADVDAPALSDLYGYGGYGGARYARGYGGD